ncbi:unnamed protein product, partial [Choristocarpus tenellus]
MCGDELTGALGSCLLLPVGNVFAPTSMVQGAATCVTSKKIVPTRIFDQGHLLDSKNQDESAVVRDRDIPVVLRSMIGQGIFSSSCGVLQNDIDALEDLMDSDQVAIVFDLDALRASLTSVKSTFPPSWRHCFALKSCPLSFVAQEVIRAGVGIEAASFGELYMGLAHGCPSSSLVFDSPAKTEAELVLALRKGILVNVNSLEELDRVAAIIRTGEGAKKRCVGGDVSKGTPSAFTQARVGVRLNPLIGTGTIKELSVSHATSKFGVPATPENQQVVTRAFAKYPWLVGLHAHVGSQGCSLEQLAEGAALLVAVADDIDRVEGAGRVTVLDIGGGLPANYTSEDASPTFQQYCSVLRHRVPSLFSPDNRRTVVTEFGRALVAKTSFTVSRVEYVREHRILNLDLKDEQGEGEECSVRGGSIDSTGDSKEDFEVKVDRQSHISQTLITHMGSDLFVRECHNPSTYPHRLSMFNEHGSPLSGETIPTDIAGPMCFNGDYLARGASLP